MGLGDCPKCWNAVCTCGHEWETWPEGGLRSIARAVNAAMVSRGFAEPTWTKDELRKEAKRIADAKEFKDGIETLFGALKDS